MLRMDCKNRSRSTQCPYQLDPDNSALHTVHHAEVLLKPGVAEQIRKQAQVSLLGLNGDSPSKSF